MFYAVLPFSISFVFSTTFFDKCGTLPPIFHTFSHSVCGKKSLLPQSTSFCTGSTSVSSSGTTGLSVVVEVVVVVLRVLVVVLLRVVVLLVVELEASGTHCPGAGVDDTITEGPSAEAVLGGRAHSGYKSFCVSLRNLLCTHY